MTVAVATGALLTVANVGDSNAFLDNGAEIMPLTAEHRVQSHRGERERLKAGNAYIAPISCYLDGPAAPGASGQGPLRHWPGGLCVSRAIGDFDAGPLILAWPSIKQVGPWHTPASGCMHDQHHVCSPAFIASASLSQRISPWDGGSGEVLVHSSQVLG